MPGNGTTPRLILTAPALLSTKLSGLIAVVDSGGQYNVLVSRGTFVRRETALAYADVLERQLAAQADSGRETE